mmetsp:Transcript_19696/g.62470  ORF Transcript_19696/g.62470 Transcript_19696/m.62470 type:complete len:246 (-) Transcript_19696:204-941(-)
MGLRKTSCCTMPSRGTTDTSSSKESPGRHLLHTRGECVPVASLGWGVLLAPSRLEATAVCKWREGARTPRHQAGDCDVHRRPWAAAGTQPPWKKAPGSSTSSVQVQVEPLAERRVQQHPQPKGRADAHGPRNCCSKVLPADDATPLPDRSPRQVVEVEAEEVQRCRQPLHRHGSGKLPRHCGRSTAHHASALQELGDERSQMEGGKDCQGVSRAEKRHGTDRHWPGRVHAELARQYPVLCDVEGR